MAGMKQFQTHSSSPFAGTQSELLLLKIMSAKVKNSLQMVLCWCQLSTICVWWPAGHVGELVGMRERLEVLSCQWGMRVSAFPDDAWGCWAHLSAIPGVAAQRTLTACSPPPPSPKLLSHSGQVTMETVRLCDEAGACGLVASTCWSWGPKSPLWHSKELLYCSSWDLCKAVPHPSSSGEMGLLKSLKSLKSKQFPEGGEDLVSFWISLAAPSNRHWEHVMEAEEDVVQTSTDSSRLSLGGKVRLRLCL